MAKYKRFSNSELFMPSILSTLLYYKLVQIFTASSRGISVKSESTSRQPMKRLPSWCIVSSAKAKESFTVNSLNVIKESLGTKNFVYNKVGVPVAEHIALNGGQTSIIAWCTLHSPYKIPGLLPITLIFLYWLIVRLPDFSNSSNNRTYVFHG